MDKRKVLVLVLTVVYAFLLVRTVINGIGTQKYSGHAGLLILDILHAVIYIVIVIIILKKHASNKED